MPAVLGDWRTQAETELGASWVTIGAGQDGCLGCQRICGSMLSPKKDSVHGHTLLSLFFSWFRALVVWIETVEEKEEQLKCF